MVPFYEHRTMLVQSRREKYALDFPMHLHICPELLYVEKGQISLDYPDRSFLLDAGDFAVVFPNTVHGYRTISAPQETDYIIAICQPQTAGEFQEPLSSCHPASPVIDGRELPPDVPALMRELAATSVAHASEPLLRALIQLILARAMPKLTLKKNRAQFFENLTVQAVSYVSAHYRESLSLDLLAERLGISRFRVSRIFSDKVHIGFTKYVNYLRTEYAKEKLKSSADSILTVALDSGFENLRTFNRVFKEITGVTPLKYRNSGGRHADKI